MSKETELSKKYRETFQIPTFYFIARTALIFSKEPFSLLCRGLTGPSCPRNGTLYLAILFPVYLRDLWHSKSVCVCVFMNEGWRWGTGSYNHLAGEGIDSNCPHPPGDCDILPSTPIPLSHHPPHNYNHWWNIVYPIDLWADRIEPLFF